ncbi:MAG: hypothetical protein ACFFB2_03720 [Promethearchaeota archaeon]
MKLKSNRILIILAGLILTTVLVCIESVPIGLAYKKIIIPHVGNEADLATAGWFDNFDGNLTDWTIENGTFSVTDSILHATGGNIWHVASHTSSVANGTWSFDVYINKTNLRLGEHLYIFFMANNLESDQQNGYDIMIWIDPNTGTPGFTLWKRVDGAVSELGSCGYPSGLSGWYHIDVTRHSNGQFYMFVDGSLKIPALDTTFTTSKYFGIVMKGGHSLDNINISNEIYLYPKPSNLKFSYASRSVSVQQKSNSSVFFYVENDGELPGSGTLTTGVTPIGINVSFDPNTITNLCPTIHGCSQRVEITVEAASFVDPGEYEVIVELRNTSHVLDEMPLFITILEAPIETTSIDTTSVPTSSAATSSKTQPLDETTSQGIPIIGLILTLSVIVLFWRKRS